MLSLGLFNSLAFFSIGSAAVPVSIYKDFLEGLSDTDRLAEALSKLSARGVAGNCSDSEKLSLAPSKLSARGVTGISSDDSSSELAKFS